MTGAAAVLSNVKVSCCVTSSKENRIQCLQSSFASLSFWKCLNSSYNVPKSPLDHVLQICQCESLYDAFILTDLSVCYLSLTELSQEWCRMWTQNQSHERVNGWCPEFYLSFFLKITYFLLGCYPKCPSGGTFKSPGNLFTQYGSWVPAQTSDSVWWKEGPGHCSKNSRWFKMACKVEQLWDSDVGWPHLGQFTKYVCLGPTPRDFHIIGLSLGVRIWKAPWWL